MILGFFIGPLEFVLLVIVILLLFGGKRFVAAGRALGRGAREFKGSLTDEEREKRRKELPERTGSPGPKDES
jgi:sec-independent protein translocase protein TatA